MPKNKPMLKNITGISPGQAYKYLNITGIPEDSTKEEIDEAHRKIAKILIFYWWLTEDEAKKIFVIEDLQKILFLEKQK